MLFWQMPKNINDRFSTLRSRATMHPGIFAILAMSRQAAGMSCHAAVLSFGTAPAAEDSCGEGAVRR